MADFTTIPDSNIEPGRPIRSIDGLALRDNPIAIAEGAAGAPRIQTAGIQNSAVTTAKIAANERMTTANVLGQTAGASVGAVGSYAFLRPNNATSYGPGSTLAGSSLRYSGALRLVNTSSARHTAVDGGAPAGTWRCMGQRTGDVGGVPNNAIVSTLWLRIS